MMITLRTASGDRCSFVLVVVVPSARGARVTSQAAIYITNPRPDGFPLCSGAQPKNTSTAVVHSSSRSLARGGGAYVDRGGRDHLWGLTDAADCAELALRGRAGREQPGRPAVHGDRQPCRGDQPAVRAA